MAVVPGEAPPSHNVRAQGGDICLGTRKQVLSRHQICPHFTLACPRLENNEETREPLCLVTADLRNSSKQTEGE